MKWSALLLSCILLLVEAALAQGSLHLDPPSGVVGAEVRATATGLAPGLAVELVWTSADPAWNVANGRFGGITATETRTVLARGVTNDDGEARLSFTVPEDFGYVHNIFLESSGDRVARQGFTLVPELSISPSSGPIGTPITVTMTGVGYRFWESVWHLLYDGAHTGWLSAITTRGTATAVIPASGALGLHTLQVISGTHPVPYLNQQQAPIYIPQIPTVMSRTFEITPGGARLPPKAATQVLPRIPGTPPDPAATTPVIWSDHVSGPVGSLIVLQGSGFPPDATIALRWASVSGNRLSGGWEETERTLLELRADADGNFRHTLPTPDDLGGIHRLSASSGDRQADLRYTVTPSVQAVAPAGVAPGGDITITLKGVGWTETANIYTLVMDNGYLGYGCGFNSQGTVVIHLKAPGQAGMHFIDLYPSIYKGELSGPGAPPDTSNANATYLQIPMLHAADHPGEELPAFHLAFEVTSPP